MIDERTAPVQGELIADRVQLPRGQVPWAVHALAAEEYNRHHDQSAEQLAERAGFGWSELIAALRGDYTAKGIRRVAADLRRVSGHTP